MRLQILLLSLTLVATSCGDIHEGPFAVRYEVDAPSTLTVGAAESVPVTGSFDLVPGPHSQAASTSTLERVVLHGDSISGVGSGGLLFAEARFFGMSVTIVIDQTRVTLSADGMLPEGVFVGTTINGIVLSGELGSSEGTQAVSLTLFAAPAGS